MTDIGRDFEKEFAAEFGLEQVPGSGNQWHSKLDVKGLGIRWSLKATRRAAYTIGTSDLREAIEVTEGIGGDGSISAMAVRVCADYNPEDFIVMRKEDFATIVTQNLQVFREDKTKEKRRHASIPELMRDNDDPVKHGLTPTRPTKPKTTLR